MKSTTEIETHAAAQAAGRELISSALQRNPVIALATVAIGPLLGLFRRRGCSLREVQKVRLESYHLRPIMPPVVGRVRRINEGPPKDDRIRIERTRSGGSRLRPGGRARGAVQLSAGGRCHG